MKFAGFGIKTTCHWFAIWNALNDAEDFVPQEVFVNLLLPVQRHGGWRVTCLRFSGGVDMYFNCRVALGGGKC